MKENFLIFSDQFKILYCIGRDMAYLHDFKTISGIFSGPEI